MQPTGDRLSGRAVKPAFAAGGWRAGRTGRGGVRGGPRSRPMHRSAQRRGRFSPGRRPLDSGGECVAGWPRRTRPARAAGALPGPRRRSPGSWYPPTGAGPGVVPGQDRGPVREGGPRRHAEVLAVHEEGRLAEGDVEYHHHHGVVPLRVAGEGPGALAAGTPQPPPQVPASIHPSNCAAGPPAPRGARRGARRGGRGGRGGRGARGAASPVRPGRPPQVEEAARAPAERNFPKSREPISFFVWGPKPRGSSVWEVVHALTARGL